MNEEILKQILTEVKAISKCITEKAEQEQIKKDLNSNDIATAASACEKVGNKDI